MARTYPTEAVVLRSLRLGEADRIVHLYTRERGRIGAVAKGIRKTKSRFGGRLEPLSHVALQLHQGSGELQTVTGVDLVRAHNAVREDPYRLNVGLIGAEAMLRLFTEQEKNDRAFTALTRFLDVLDEGGTPASSPALDPLALSFLDRDSRARCSARRHGVVRVPRRLQAADAERLKLSPALRGPPRRAS